MQEHPGTLPFCALACGTSVARQVCVWEGLCGKKLRLSDGSHFKKKDTHSNEPTQSHALVSENHPIFITSYALIKMGNWFMYLFDHLKNNMRASLSMKNDILLQIWIISACEMNKTICIIGRLAKTDVLLAVYWIVPVPGGQTQSRCHSLA